MNKNQSNSSKVNCKHTKAKCNQCGHEGCIYGGCKNEIYWWDESKMLDYPSGCIKCKSKSSIIVTEEGID
jgi:hypothetical protein